MNEQNPDYLLDLDLAAAIAATLNLQLNGSGGGVTVSVNNGVVTLEGTTETEAAKRRAERVVRQFVVAGVVNAIAVAGRRTLSRDGRRAQRPKPIESLEVPPVSE